MPRSRRALLPVAAALALAVTAAGTAAAATAPDGLAIYQHWQAQGGALGALGPAVSPDLPTPYRPGAYQVFSAGSIYWSASTGAQDVKGLIRDDWAALGHENSALGFPTSEEYALPGHAVFQTFEAGLDYFSPATGAHEVRGAILGEYGALGYEGSALGFPVTDELPTPGGAVVVTSDSGVTTLSSGRYEVFQNGSIYWSPLTGAHAISGDIRDKWGALGYEQSNLGFPTSDALPVPGGLQQSFLLGSISSTPAAGAYVSGFFAPVSSVDRAGSTFTVQMLQQSFSYDRNDTFLLLSASSGGTVPQPVTLTKKQFTDDLGVDTFILAKGYSPDPKSKATYEILDLASVPTTAAARAALLRALP